MRAPARGLLVLDRGASAARRLRGARPRRRRARARERPRDASRRARLARARSRRRTTAGRAPSRGAEAREYTRPVRTGRGRDCAVRPSTRAGRREGGGSLRRPAPAAGIPTLPLGEGRRAAGAVVRSSSAVPDATRPCGSQRVRPRVRRPRRQRARASYAAGRPLAALPARRLDHAPTRRRVPVMRSDCGSGFRTVAPSARARASTGRTGARPSRAPGRVPLDRDERVARPSSSAAPARSARRGRARARCRASRERARLSPRPWSRPGTTIEQRAEDVRAALVEAARDRAVDACGEILDACRPSGRGSTARPRDGSRRRRRGGTGTRAAPRSGGPSSG